VQYFNPDAAVEIETDVHGRCKPEAMKEKILGLPKNIFLLGLTSLFNDFSSEMVLSIFPAFFVAVLKSGAESLGLVEGFAEGVSNFFKIYSGVLSDRLQKRKPIVVLGYTLSVMTRPFYNLVSTVGGVFALRFIDRVGKGLRDSPRDAIISLSAAPEEFGKSFGYHRAMDTMGAILGPLVAYLLLTYFPARFDTVFITAFGVGILAIFTLIFISDITTIPAVKSSSIVASFNRLPYHYKFFLLAIFILAAGSLPVAVLLLKTESIGLVVASIPLFYMVYNLSYAAFSISAGKMSDRIGARTTIMIGYTVLIISYLFLNVAQSKWTLLLSFLFLGFFPALTDGVQRSLAAQLTSEELRGGAFGLLHAANGIGAMIAGLGGGYLWQTYSPAAAFLTAAVVIILGLLLFLLASPSAETELK
jgi:MFS family permease